MNSANIETTPFVLDYNPKWNGHYHNYVRSWRTPNRWGNGGPMDVYQHVKFMCRTCLMEKYPAWFPLFG